ncbi:hypothetical protein [Cryobacterium sp. N22]|uniref:hypothetical protein n=1 Tax=Cryobacterium sp. N22 TaxID=2048290 RepID=UPI000CE449E5|nr:hypothetical protein [Cryobacterium sp. N22]
MADSFAPMLSGMAGMFILIFMLPIIGALSIGLIYVGLLRRRFGLLFIGIAFPLGAFALGSILRDSAINAPGMPASYEASFAPLTSMLPIGLLIAAAIFLVGILPTMVRATLKR